MIAKALGQNARARDYLGQVMRLNSHFSVLYGDLAAATLKDLGGTGTSMGGKDQ